MKFFLSILFILCICFTKAQTDSTNTIKPQPTIHTKPKAKVIDTNTVVNDSLTQKNTTTTQLADTNTVVKTDSASNILKDSTTYNLLLQYPILNNTKPFVMLTGFKTYQSNDLLFYFLLGITLFFAIVRMLFPRYVKNIFAIVLQTKFRQVQTREQLVQDNVASILLNSLFIISSSIFIALLANKFNINKINFWQMAAYASLCLVIIYVIKLLFTKFIGWIFNKPNAANAYNFIVFIINKIIGVAIIPFLFLIAFSSVNLSHYFLTISLLLIALLLIFRLVLTYKNVSNILKINAIHFFLYFCSIEILPLLLMYKALSNYMGNGI